MKRFLDRLWGNELLNSCYPLVLLLVMVVSVLLGFVFLVVVMEHFGVTPIELVEVATVSVLVMDCLTRVMTAMKV